MDTPTRFKFKPLNDKGEEEGFFSKKGSFDGTTLVLGKDRVPVEAVSKAQQRFNRLVLGLVGQEGGIVLAITKGDAGRLAAAINRRSSARWSELRIKALEKEGKAGTYRSALCPTCQCTVDLSGFAASPQMHCPYCDTVSTLRDDRPQGEAKLRCCDACGFYAMPRPFTECYFYFLLVVWGYSYKKKYQCHSCMRSEAWKMFFANFLFILGVPVAITQLIRAYKGGDFGAKAFAGLDAANALAKKGKVEAADQRYQDLIDTLPAAAGVHYNRALAHAMANDWAGAIAACESSLKDCTNYQPAAELLGQGYAATKQTEKLERLKVAWAG